MSQHIVDQVMQSPRLPSLPAIAIEVIRLVQQRDVNIKQIADTIEKDPALSTKILKTVNSSFYGQAYTISTISHAIVVLGLSSVKTLALGFSLVGNLNPSAAHGFNHMRFWKRSLLAATGAKSLATSIGLVQKEEAFLGGLLQDLGMLAMVQTLGERYQDILRDAGGDHEKLREIERERLVVDHAEVGAMLAEQWRLPPVLVAPIRCHDCPDKADEEVRQIVQAVAAGNRAAEVFMAEPDHQGQALEGFYESVEGWFGMDRARAQPLLGTIHQQAGEMKRLFELPTGELGNADEILARANEALLQLSLESQQATTELQAQNQRLMDEAYTDSLTGVPNRRRFNEYISEQFTQCRRKGRALSVLFLDTDHFKQFNDTYGHPTGDRVLVALGDALQSMIDGRGVACRYGGEEFAVVLPDTTRREAARLAERTRLAIEGITVASDDGKPLCITASIGVATDEGATFQRVEQLVKAADQGVYAAKAAGRNCVRVFVPRPAETAAA